MTSNDTAWSPRLAAIFDVKGDGRLRVTGELRQVRLGASGHAGRQRLDARGQPGHFYWFVDDVPRGSSPSTPTRRSPSSRRGRPPAVLRLPSRLPAACRIPSRQVARCRSEARPAISGVNQQIRIPRLPNAQEFLVGLSGSIGSKGNLPGRLREAGVSRLLRPAEGHDDGKVAESGQPRPVFRPWPDRQLRRLHPRTTPASTRSSAIALASRFNLGGVWTWSHVIGDLVGETAGSSRHSRHLHTYPEYFDRKWNAPDWRPQQRHPAPRPALRIVRSSDSGCVRQPQRGRHPGVGYGTPVRRGWNDQDGRLRHEPGLPDAARHRQPTTSPARDAFRLENVYRPTWR